MGPSISVIKDDIDNQMRNLYNRYSKVCQTKSQLNAKLETCYLSSDLIKNIKDNNEADNYYKKVKNKYLEQFELICINKRLEKQIDDLLEQQMDDNYHNNFLQQQLREEISKNNEKMRFLENQSNKLREQLQEMYKKQQEALIDHQNYLRQIQYQNYEEIEKKDKALEEIMKRYKTEMTIMKQKAEKDKQQFEEKQKKAEEDYKKAIEILEKRIKEEEDEFKKQEIIKQQELDKRKREISNIFIKKIENIKKEKIDEILKNFDIIKDNYCIDKISEFTNERMELFILKLFKSEYIKKTIIYHLNICINNIQNKIKNIEHLNILLVGPTGVGKSSLINALLNTNAKVSFGKPGTKEFHFYSSDKIPFLRLIDARGIEKDNSFGVNSLYELIKEFIQTKIKENDPDKFIHCIWYCWCGTRFEDSEFHLLEKLREQYTVSTLPITIVYTQAINKEGIIKAKDHILSNFKINEDDFIPILAKEIEISNSDIKIPPFGLNKLIGVTINKVTDAVDSACYEGLMEEMKKNIKNNLEDLMKKLKEKSDKNVRNNISYMSKRSKIIDLKKETIDFITDLIYQYFFMGAGIQYNKITGVASNNYLKYSISPLTKLNIKEFVIQFFEAIYRYFNKNLDEIVNKYATQILIQITNFQMDYNLLHENLLEVTWTTQELENHLKNCIKESVYQKFELFTLKNSYSFITNKLIEEFGKFFKDSYIEAMEEDKFKLLAKTMIKVSFDKIKQKIKEYNEKNKEKSIEIAKIEETKKEEPSLMKQLFDEEDLEIKTNNEDNNNKDNDNKIMKNF